MLLAKASTKTGTPTGWHVVPDCRLVTSNLENLKHPEAAASVDGQLPCCSAALTTHEGVSRLVTLYPAGLGATMTRIRQVTSFSYI